MSYSPPSISSTLIWTFDLTRFTGFPPSVQALLWPRHRHVYPAIRPHATRFYFSISACRFDPSDGQNCFGVAANETSPSGKETTYSAQGYNTNPKTIELRERERETGPGVKRWRCMSSCSDVGVGISLKTPTVQSRGVSTHCCWTKQISGFECCTTSRQMFARDLSLVVMQCSEVIL